MQLLPLLRGETGAGPKGLAFDTEISAAKAAQAMEVNIMIQLVAKREGIANN